ncbi:MAG: energy transducer TonB [Cyclobacteriaceae bacterium]
MKKNLNVLILAIVLIVAQACGSESRKNEESADAEVSAKKATVVLTATERKAKLDKERAERLELRKIEFDKLAESSPTYTNASGKIVFYKSEIAPSFNGGEKAMMEFLRDNVKFPKEAEEKDLEGTVFVDFVVAANGIVREVEVTDETSMSVDQSFRTEAIRVVTSMPNWIPGSQQGKPVDVKFTIPITFQMI